MIWSEEGCKSSFRCLLKGLVLRVFVCVCVCVCVLCVVVRVCVCSLRLCLLVSMIVELRVCSRIHWFVLTFCSLWKIGPSHTREPFWQYAGAKTHHIRSFNMSFSKSPAPPPPPPPPPLLLVLHIQWSGLFQVSDVKEYNTVTASLLEANGFVSATSFHKQSVAYKKKASPKGVYVDTRDKDILKSLKDPNFYNTVGVYVKLKDSLQQLHASEAFQHNHKLYEEIEVAQHEVCDVWCVMYDVWWMMYGVWCMMFDVWCMMYDVWCMMYGVWCMMCDVWCMMFNRTPETCSSKYSSNLLEINW